MKKQLIAFVMESDFRAVGMPITNQPFSSCGPICWTMEKVTLDNIILVYSKDCKEFSDYVYWLKKITKTPIATRIQKGDDKSNAKLFVEICKECIDVLEDKESLCIFSSIKGVDSESFRYVGRRLVEYIKSLQKNCKARLVRVPFDSNTYKAIQQDFAFDRYVFDASQVPLEFKKIIHRSQKMAQLIERAGIVAMSGATVLIQGESGTGKELLARAIHEASSLKGQPFIAVNCGAISSELVESEFFGHIKGAFTGAVNTRDGYFKCADNGTLFLDEIGELPLAAQVKILRVLQEGELTPVGATKSIAVNVRVIAATNRLLAREVKQGRFREDLFYRLAVAILNVPPLRERVEDIDPLIDYFLEELGGLRKTRVSSSAREFLKRQRWSGNIRELHNLLLRASFWSNEVINVKDVQDALDAVSVN